MQYLHVSQVLLKTTREWLSFLDVDPTFTPIQSTEYNSEIYYGIRVTDWLTVRPNLQYVVHPGGTDHVDTALVAGIKLHTKF
ncbi:carbohydrate porin [Pseudomonas mediterranea]|uniref:carbohydrate porin n=1 Tax=Pseudomonas mediterranea TaxID=183795 RepID=UPI003BF5FD5D